MKKHLQTFAVPAAIAASFLVGCGAPRITARTDPDQPSIVQVQQGYDTFGRRWEDQAKPAESKMIRRNVATTQNFTGTITDIDFSEREVTLKDAQGKEQTFSVSKNVQRFSEAKVGDKVSIDYYFGYNAEVRKPTAEEQQNPLVVLSATGRAGPDETPAGASMRQIRAVVTIAALDRENQTITVKGPRGKYYVAQVADPSRFDQVNIGDTIVMTFTEAQAVSLTPAED